MKKTVVLFAILAAAAFVTGCATSLTCHGFDYAGPGLILTDVYKGGYIAPKAESLKEVTVLGPVSGISKSTSILGWVSNGDSSILAAKNDALKGLDADDILNIEVDTKVKSILGVISEVELHLRGIAVKYKK
ncbi:MAG: hypothetical protein GX946_02830 [Oligosphaeraceae bacterium]|nr:hypothetical protein [Oligosphaeraceae bacterium]